LILTKQSQFIPLENVMYFIMLRFLVRKIFTFYINDVLLYKYPVSRPKVQDGSELFNDTLTTTDSTKLNVLMVRPTLTHWGRVTQICVFNTRLFSLHNTL